MDPARIVPVTMRRPRPTGRAAAATCLAIALGLLAPVAFAAPAPAARPVGSQPLQDVVAAADAAARSDCGLTGPRVAAMMLSVVYHETGAIGSVAPSPMTLSRFDVNAGLFAFNDPNTAYRRAYFNPGVGMWQFDSAGLGQPHAASYYMNTATGAPAAAAAIVSRWCTAWAQPGTYPDDLARRAYVWAPWNACKPTAGYPNGRCEVVYGEIFDGTSLVNLDQQQAVSRTGGMQARRCQNRTTGAVVDCFWVDTALAEGYGAGSVAWANPNSSSGSPLTAPFYVYEQGGFEYRHWLAADTGYPGDITAARPLNRNARGNLRWSSGPGVCDLTLNRGACVPDPPLGPAAPVTATNPAIVGQGRGVGLVAYNGQTVIGERRSDGSSRISYLAAPIWSGWQHLGGTSTGDPDLAAWGNDHLEVFIRGSDGAIWRNVLAGGGASGWTSLGGQFTSGPSAVSWAPGRVDVFARGLDGALWASYLQNGAFSGWYSLGGQIISDPDVASWAPNRLDVFAAGTDQQLWHRAWNGSTFQPWEPLGGTLTSSPAAASSAPNRIDIAVRGSGGATYVRQWNGATFTPYSSLGGSSQSAPELARTGDGTVVLVVRGSDGQLYRRNRDGAGTWTGWTPTP